MGSSSSKSTTRVVDGLVSLTNVFSWFSSLHYFHLHYQPTRNPNTNNAVTRSASSTDYTLNEIVSQDRRATLGEIHSQLQRSNSETNRFRSSHSTWSTDYNSLFGETNMPTPRTTSTTFRTVYPSTGSSISTMRQPLTTMNTANRLEEADIARAIELSIRTNRTSSVTTSSVVSCQKNHQVFLQYFIFVFFLKKQSSRVLSSQQPKNSIANVSRTEIAPSASTSKGEMAFDCSICMEFNDKDVIVATECGHVFHKDCVTPWIHGAGTCPTCRVRVTISSLRKIFVSVSSRGGASASTVTTEPM